MSKNPNVPPFGIGDTVKCRDVATGTPLQLGANYVVTACANIRKYWMVQIQGPHGFNNCGIKTWYLARRFV